MAWEIETKEIRQDMQSVIEPEIRFKIERALECLNDPPRHRIVTDAISVTRKSGYSDLSLKLASLAYESNPDNPYFLGTLCTGLSNQGESEEIIKKVKIFLNLVDINSLAEKEREMVITNYASGFKGTGNFKEGIKILENFKSNEKKPVELLSELYYMDNQPDKTIKLLENRGQLTSEMAYWMAKAIISIDQTAYAFDYAINILEPHSNRRSALTV